MEAGDVQRELDELAATLGRSVSLDGPDGTLLGYSTQGADVDPVRVQAILLRRVPETVLAYQRGFGLDTATGPVRLPANPELGMTARICVPVRAGDHLVAYLWILDDGVPVDGGPVEAAPVGGGLVGGRLVGGGPVGGGPVGGALVGGAPVGGAPVGGAPVGGAPVGGAPVGGAPVGGALVGGAPFGGLPLDGPAVVACGGRLAALLRPAPGLDTLLADLFTDRPRPDLAADLGPVRFVAVAATTIRDGQRVPAPDRLPPTVTALGSAVVNGRRLALVRHPPSAGLRPEPGAVTGFSRPFRADPAVMSTLAARAIVTADCAATDPALPATLGWDDLGLHRRLLLTTDPAGWPEPLPVAATLRHTLEVYLDNAGNAARTIAALKIHRTTFYYRLERLATHHGIRLDDGLARTDLHLALKTHRLAQARDVYGWTGRFLGRLR